MNTWRNNIFDERKSPENIPPTTSIKNILNQSGLRSNQNFYDPIRQESSFRPVRSIIRDFENNGEDFKEERRRMQDETRRLRNQNNNINNFNNNINNFNNDRC
jgi:hypothetical protein